MDRAVRADVKTYSGKAVPFTVSQFKNWVKSGSPEPTGANVETIANTQAEKICPICGKKLVVRIAGKGPNSGNLFWGCSAYPDCNHTEKFDQLYG